MAFEDDFRGRFVILGVQRWAAFSRERLDGFVGAFAPGVASDRAGAHPRKLRAAVRRGTKPAACLVRPLERPVLQQMEEECLRQVRWRRRGNGRDGE